MKPIEKIVFEVAVRSAVPMDLLLLADEEENLEKYINDSIFFAAMNQASMVGVAALKEIDGDTAEIVNIGVTKPWQNKGIGTCLLNMVIHSGRDKGYKKLIIKTGDTSVIALRLYTNAGFTTVSINKNYFVENLKQPIFENGVQCRDQVVLEYEIDGKIA
jgi:ribosomal protein S18 acetylase RimI-like enzyme